MQDCPDTTIPDSNMLQIAGVKSMLFDACLRNGLHMPSYKSKTCTTSFLHEVAAGKCFAFSVYDIRLANCPSPPTLPEVVDLVLQNIDVATRDPQIVAVEKREAWVNLRSHIALRCPDKTFLL